jgi:hypothetical protein
MYDNIEQGKHIKKPNCVEVEPVKSRPKQKKSKEARIQQLNVEVRSN